MIWIDYQGPRDEGIAAGWLAMHDANTAVAAVFCTDDGRFMVVYSIAGQVFPTVERFFPTLKAAQARAERAVEQHLICPRHVLTIGASNGKERKTNRTH